MPTVAASSSIGGEEVATCYRLRRGRTPCGWPDMCGRRLKPHTTRLENIYLTLPSVRASQSRRCRSQHASEEADQALCRAKNAGCNCVELSAHWAEQRPIEERVAETLPDRPRRERQTGKCRSPSCPGERTRQRPRLSQGGAAGRISTDHVTGPASGARHDSCR